MPYTIDIPHSRSASDETAASFEEIPQQRSGLAELAESYRRLGRDEGYAQASRDQLAYSVLIAEQILHEQSEDLKSAAAARRLLYSFIARMDRRLSLFAGPSQTPCEQGYMEGGLGI